MRNGSSAQHSEFGQASRRSWEAALMEELGIRHTYIEAPGAAHELWIRHNPAKFFNGLSN
jgi:hypothetical protein